jgi:internalin A
MNREELLAVIEEAKQRSQTMLDLSWAHIEDLPEEIQELDSLTHLNLSHNRLTRLPESLGSLINLVSLEVMNNQLTGLPESIGELNGLTMLDVRSNAIRRLPETIGNLIFLTTFRIWENKLDEIPESIGGLTELTSLNLGFNQLRHLPDSIGMLLNLTDLTVCRNRLETLPDSIGKLASIRNLDFSYNQINVLPSSITSLETLRNINIRNNQIGALPESIGRMRSLIRLDCNSNKLESIPASIGELAQLESLILYKNLLHDLPSSIALLPNLKEDQFYFGENPWSELPPEIVNQGSKSILRYCWQRLNEGTFDWLYEAKLLIVGEGGAGKTTLSNKLKNANYTLDEQERSTKGIDVTSWDFPHPKGYSFRINIWDFGGQAIYHATHQFFLTKRSLYVLVADTRQEDTDFNYWLEMVEVLSEGSPILIVKNEKQDRRCEINENQLRERFGSLEKILATNLAFNRGLPEVLDAVKFHISQLPHVGTPLPKTWVHVRQALENDPRDYITQAEFLTLCDTHGFNACEDKLQLSSYLHDLGVYLHFQDDPILRNWIILKPEWGTTAVYTVLDTPKVQENFGCFTHADLATIWEDGQYTDMRDELLQLMMRFKLCYEIPHRPHTYIAPQLRSPNQPKYGWDNSANLILRYKYKFMPKGMLTRFTVEMHRLIDNDLVWKDGVILTDGNARAEVIEACYKNEICIRISGKIKKSLLERVRHEFDKIHESYDRLRYKEYIPCNCSVCHGSQTPHSYPLNRLQERLQNDRQEIECDISYKMVSVRGLIDDAIGEQYRSQTSIEHDRYTREHEGMTDPAQALLNLTIINKPEATAVNPQPQRNQTFNAPVGVVANDHAQVTNFTQINNANTAELLQLIATMRQTAAQFPQEIQDDIIIDIDDVEAEIKKPEADRNIPKIKKRLIAILAAVGLITGTIASATDFANNAIDVGSKLGIELHLPPATQNKAPDGKP